MKVNWLLQTIEDPENANYDMAKDSSCHDTLTGTDVIEVLETSPQRRRRTRNMEIQSPLEFFARSPRTWSSTYPPNDADQGGCRRHLQEAFQLAFGSLSKCHRLIEKQRSKHREPFMKIVVIGGSGFIGSKLVPRLGQRGHDAVAASPNSGVNSVTGEGLAEVLKGASMVVDVSNAPSWEASAVLNFFETSTRNLLKYGAEAGIKHFAALSVVGTQRLSESAYFRAKIAQEKLIENATIPYSIVQATQFFEFLKGIAHFSMQGDKVHLPPVLFQPMAADDVASGVGKIALSAPVNGTVEIAGPQLFRLDELVRRRLAQLNDPREVITDPQARYSGALLAH